MRYYAGQHGADEQPRRNSCYRSTNPFNRPVARYPNGRLTAVTSGLLRTYNTTGGIRWVAVTEMYSYTADGRLVKKRLQLKDGSGTAFYTDM